jgi:short chain dehydrogenase
MPWHWGSQKVSPPEVQEVRNTGSRSDMHSSLYQTPSISGQVVLITGVGSLLCSLAYAIIVLTHFMDLTFCRFSSGIGACAINKYSLNLCFQRFAGASSGIGQACAYRFAEAGCKLVILARRTERLESLKQELHSRFEVAVFPVTLDVRDIDALQDLPNQLPPEFREVW